MRSFSTLILGVAALAVSAAAHSIQLHPHTRDCYHETLHREDRMTVSYQVGDREFGSAGNLEIDFWVRTLGLSVGVWGCVEGDDS